ncbi:hypothetical protein BDV40DRAFT_265247 [Aspergillus tamarii]|uniref:Uncharacterized protein n=1 Tax=Aspergillus tamarii TaxID=41984 RepID=A0A5N6UV44_ASPTM|nr:hypothetical protein BDV40DRAFT_265247 [Aspergillus tamarii]
MYGHKNLNQPGGKEDKIKPGIWLFEVLCYKSIFGTTRLGLPPSLRYSTSCTKPTNHAFSFSFYSFSLLFFFSFLFFFNSYYLFSL